MKSSCLILLALFAWAVLAQAEQGRAELAAINAQLLTTQALLQESLAVATKTEAIGLAEAKAVEALGLARAHSRTGDVDAATAQYRRLIDLDPGNEAAREELARLLFEARDLFVDRDRVVALRGDALQLLDLGFEVGDRLFEIEIRRCRRHGITQRQGKLRGGPKG